MLNELTLEQKKLADFMSEISERCYYSGWYKNLEYILWDALNNGPRSYGHGQITQQDITTLRQLSDAAKCWTIFRDDTEETAIDFNLWTNKFRADINKDATLLKG